MPEFGSGLMRTRNSNQPGSVVPSAKNHVVAVPAAGCCATAGSTAEAAARPSKATVRAKQVARVIDPQQSPEPSTLPNRLRGGPTGTAHLHPPGRDRLTPL